MALTILVFLKNAWVAEDAYILFRSIAQLAAGNGPIWNPHERVQVFTSPLWFWVLSATRLFSADLFLTTILLSLALWLLCLYGVWRLAREPARFLLSVSLLVASSAFFDFTTSGLENVLAYALLALFLTCLIRPSGMPAETGTDRQPVGSLYLQFILAGLILLVRHDLIFLIGPAVIFSVYSNFRLLSLKGWFKLLATSGSPFVVWTLFSLVYYGFPVPNTAYAKLNTGVPRLELVGQGLIYLRASAAFDSITMIVILLAVLKLLSFPGKRVFQFLGLGILLNLAYVVFVGGDFMQGRFLSYAFLVSAATLPLLLPKQPARVLPVLGVIWIYALLFPHTPVNSPIDYENRICLVHWQSEPILDSVADERGYYFRNLSLNNYFRSRQEGRFFPDHPWALKALLPRADAAQVPISRNIGLLGYFSHLDRILLDPAALSDPLLARLKVRGKKRIGHFDREIPDGYAESLESGQAVLEDPDLNAYYEKIQLITQSSSLFAPERLAAIFDMNLGRFEYLKESYERRPPSEAPPLYVP